METNLDRSKLKELVISQINRKIIFLTKLQLEFIDELRSGPYNISNQALDLQRKRELDRSNSILRDIEGFLDKLDFDLKNNK